MKPGDRPPSNTETQPRANRTQPPPFSARCPMLADRIEEFAGDSESEREIDHGLTFHFAIVSGGEP